MKRDVDIAIIGGGIAGLSLAAQLAGQVDLAVLEAEEQTGYHATGRSAAIFAQNYGPRLIRALTAWSAPVFAQMDVLSPRGLVRAGTLGQTDAIRALYEDMSQDTPLTWLDEAALAERVPLLRPDVMVAGFENPAAADMDVAGIMQRYERAAQGAGAQFLTRFRVSFAARKDDAWVLRDDRGQELRASIVVNAAGAWADEVAALCGAAPVGLVPKRRSAVTFDAPEGFDCNAMPMVVDAEESFYAKPEGGRIMGSPADETPSPATDARPEEIDIAICLDRIERAFQVSTLRPQATWAGLRTFAPDGLPVCGWDSNQRGFFWLAGQGGYGVQTAPALARLAADALTDGPLTEMIGVTPEAVSPARLQG